MPEDVVLLAEDGAPTGSVPRATVHEAHTPLDPVLSRDLSRSDARVLMTHGALSKRVWPRVWTNSICGHPQSGEKASSAVPCRAGDPEELGSSVVPTSGLSHSRCRSTDWADPVF